MADLIAKCSDLVEFPAEIDDSVRKLMRLSNVLVKLGLVLALVATRVLAEPQAAPSDVDKTESNIARMTAAFLQQQHFSHHEFDVEIAGKFMDRYIDTLDGQRIYFLQSDLKEFESFRTN
jgi:carboxyl-terminal processing protease